VIVLPEFGSAIDRLRLVGGVEALKLLRLHGINTTANLYLILGYRFSGSSIPFSQSFLRLLAKGSGPSEPELGGEGCLGL
jgi:hypothetical protein